MNKIDFAVIITAEMCNPNGDPLCSNRPRMDSDGYGEISDVCIKRKIRNRLQDMGYEIFVHTNTDHNKSRSMNGMVKSYKAMYDEIQKKDNADVEKIQRLGCEKWIDVRTFGQIFPVKGLAASTAVRGPVSICHGKSLEPLDIEEQCRITILNSIDEGIGKDKNTIYSIYLVKKGAYIVYGSIFPCLAEKTGFSDSDVNLIKEALRTLLEGDASNARPSGSMSSRLYWWEHNCKYGVMSSAKVFQTLHIKPTNEYPYYVVAPEDIEGVKLEVYDW